MQASKGKQKALLRGTGACTLLRRFCCCAEGYVRLYRLVDNGRRLELVHKTAVGGIPGALAAFKGRLLVGVGPILRLYDMGKKKLLRKSEYRRYAAYSDAWIPAWMSVTTLVCHNVRLKISHNCNQERLLFVMRAHCDQQDRSTAAVM